MQITLLRHLPTEWNKKTWLQGRRDVGISKVNEDTHKKITENLHVIEKLAPFDIVLASTLKRTRQTANFYGFQPETDELLDELDFGPFEGMPKEVLLKEHGEQWVENPKELVLGESLVMFEQRIINFLEKYKSCKKILIFGHGSWNRALLSYSRYGNINQMNKITFDNNECITVQYNPL